jgi:A/G-specific adenine glycosylase
MTLNTRLTPAHVRAFQKKIYQYYRDHGRSLPWRRTKNPYRVLVSEVMLQQTQVERVIEKYREFLAAFPDFASLAQAPTAKLLRLWSGMGYNRRALALKKLAQKVVTEHREKLPSDPSELVELPGIGPYTAGAVAAFAFNRPVVFLDTNIRRVFLHEFFHERTAVRDEDLTPLIEQTLDPKDPRTWYNALMDYGAMLKREHGNPNRRSAHYTRQSAFESSNRRVRGLILKALVKESPLSQARIVRETGVDPDRIQKNLGQLVKEGFIMKKGRTYFL